MRRTETHQQQHNKSLDVRAKQRLSYHVVRLTRSCACAVSPHVNSDVGRLAVNYFVAEMIDERHNPNFIADVAGSVLSKKFGERISLQAGETFITDGSIVVRCSVVDSGSDVPASVIVKKTRETVVMQIAGDKKYENS